MASPHKALIHICLSYCLLSWRGLYAAHARRMLAPSGSTRSQELVLLGFASQLENFKDVKDVNHFQGWNSTSTACSAAPGQSITSNSAECDPANQVYRSAARNAWTGVTCNPAGEVACIHLAGLGLYAAASSLAALNDLPALMYLNLESNKLSGPLPADVASGLNSLERLHLAYNRINDTLGPYWGEEGAWGNLEELYLQDNLFYGLLPSEWGEEGRWARLRQLNLTENRLQGSIPGGYAINDTSWPELEQAFLQPGNMLCGSVPEGFPAYKSEGRYLTGTTQAPLQDLGRSCTPDDEQVDATDFYGDHAGDSLSEAAIAGIIAGEVLIGAFLLLLAGVMHRRYRWKSEQSWVLFDWDVVADKAPPKIMFNFVHRFGHGNKSVDAGLFGQNPGNSSANSPARNMISTPSQELAEVAALNGHAGLGYVGAKSLPEQVLEESTVQPEDVRLQQKADGTLYQLGSGSFGKVYKGVLHEVDEVAVKVFQGYVGQQGQDLLLKEISILRSCRNKNIVQFFGVAFQGEDIWMLMELMEGNLARHLARGHHCTWYFRGRSIALDIARGMHFLHSRRIIHMDLKSPNILLGETGIAKIADVGLARVMGADSVVDQVCAGTMHWMAPEVLINNCCTEKADIFSFGVILWEICTAEAPTRGRMNPVSVPEECPEDVQSLIELCMEEDPKKRPSALEIIHKIEAIPVTTRPVPQPPWYAR